MSSHNLNHSLHRTAFTHNDFYSQIPFRTHTHTHTFTLRPRKSLCTEQHFTQKSFYTNEPLHIAACTHRGSCAKKALHKENSAWSNYFAQTHVRGEDFMQKPVHRATFTGSSMCTQISFTHRSFYRDELLHTNTKQPSQTCRLHA